MRLDKTPATFLVMTLLTAVFSASTASASSPPKPLTVDGVRAWQQGGGLEAASRDWPAERKVDLDGDGVAELLLAIGGGESALVFALFARDGGDWRLLADDIAATPPLVDVLAADRDGWHDLAAFERRGSDGYRLRVYGWNGRGYAEQAVRVETVAANELRVVDASIPATAGSADANKPGAASGTEAAASSVPPAAKKPAAEATKENGADKGEGWWHHPNEPRRPTVMPRRR
jgi:opacity protein-like surface antigen